uniref:hypothetical protein n=1 Tax=Streptomyces tubercidicus TaxID=47759 RepID=UPI0030E55C7A
MTAGRGRPVVFDEPAQTEFLRLVAGGARIGEAATKLGVGRRTPEQLARRDKAFARQLDAARTAGRDHRIPHGTPGGYNNHKCRCAPCTAEATRARSNAPDRKHADIHRLPAPQPPTATTKFPVLADVG